MLRHFRLYIFLGFLCGPFFLYAEGNIIADKAIIIKANNGEAIPFTIDIALSNKAKQRGLMYKRSIKPDYGMLFYYNTPQTITMWMRNTYISLDMIFINADNIITHIAHNTKPLSDAIIAGPPNSIAVLEIQGGQAKKHDITPGDRIMYEQFTP